MTSVQEEKNEAVRTTTRSSLLLCLVAITAVSNTALIFTLLTSLTWAERFAVVFAAAAMTGAAVYTACEMARLGNESR